MLLVYLCFIMAWLYSLFSLVYIPIKIVYLKHKSRDVWAFLSRRRLLFSALAYLAAAPFLGMMALFISAASVSGGHAVGVSDSLENFAWGVCFVFLAEAVVAVALIFVRPRRDRA